VESIIVPIVVAVIGGPIVVLLSKVRSENTSQHAEARTLLRQVATKVDKVGTKLDEHIGWHKGQQGK
jgi:hypothetical protein